METRKSPEMQLSYLEIPVVKDILQRGKEKYGEMGISEVKRNLLVEIGAGENPSV